MHTHTHAAASRALAGIGRGQRVFAAFVRRFLRIRARANTHTHTEHILIQHTSRAARHAFSRVRIAGFERY